MAGGKKIRKILFRLIGVVIAVALLALLAASLIIAKPQEETAAAVTDRPSGEASPAISVEKEQDLHRLIASFPAPVMSFMSGSGMTFVSATSADSAVPHAQGTQLWETDSQGSGGAETVGAVSTLHREASG